MAGQERWYAEVEPHCVETGCQCLFRIGIMTRCRSWAWCVNILKTLRSHLLARGIVGRVSARGSQRENCRV